MPELNDDKGIEGSFNNKEQISRSKRCGCFSCLGTFDATTIKYWIDNDTTALCPICSIDSVLGDATEDIGEERLKYLKRYWFNDTVAY